MSEIINEKYYENFYEDNLLFVNFTYSCEYNFLWY
jgi:hypothetical protein